mmetsp:Transcript_12860/g.58036  ORF Transcript_12860/g.58036 Transcript_12860/m.58036 type:complete len:212 (-) Transcript_12860:1144-1779(-)
MRIVRTRRHARHAHAHVAAHAHSRAHPSTSIRVSPRVAPSPQSNPPISRHSRSPSRAGRSIGAAARSARTASRRSRSAVRCDAIFVAVIGESSASGAFAPSVSASAPVNAATHARTPPSVHRTLARLAAASPVALRRASVNAAPPGVAPTDVTVANPFAVSIPSDANPATLASSLLLSARIASVTVAASAKAVNAAASARVNGGGCTECTE